MLWFFQWSCMDVRLGCEESWEPKNWCFWTVVLEKTLESPLVCKKIQPVHPKGAQSWVFIGRTDAEAETPTLATSCEELTHWKRSWCWEGLGAVGEGDGRGWNGWIASLTQWAWVWINSGSLWGIGRPGVLQFMGSQRVGHDWTTELNWTDTGKDWRQKDKGMTEDEMVGWYHWLNRHEFEQALGVGDGQGSLECCSPWGDKESNTTERLNWTEPCLDAF